MGDPSEPPSFTSALNRRSAVARIRTNIRRWNYDSIVIQKRANRTSNVILSEPEVEDVLARPIEERRGIEGARVAMGQTQARRYIRVIYVPGPDEESLFVITGYQLGANALRALRRRRRRRR